MFRRVSEIIVPLLTVLSFFWVLPGYLFCLLRLLYLHVYLPLTEYWLEFVLGVSEEFSKAIVRESFHHLIRFINGLFAWIVSSVDRANKLYTSTQTRRPSFSGLRWENLRPSGLNWIVESEAMMHSPTASISGS